MNKLALLLGAGALLLLSSGSSASSSSSAAPPPPPPGPPPKCPRVGTRVLLIGDSLAVGLKAPLGDLARACATPFVGRSFIGAHVTQWDGRDARLGQALSANAPTVALISLGANDFGRTDPDNVVTSIARMVAALRAAGVTPLWMNPPAMPFADPNDVRGTWRAAIGDSGAVFDAERLEVPRAPDGIHPTIGGYNQLARAFWAWLSAREARP